MSLATKYRPKDFNEVVGQETTVDILTKEVETNTIKQSYLFVGKSGAGKSTSARILANKINGFTIEIDAASNNSAESMRNLLDAVKTRPLADEYYVVILDEVHSLSQMATQTLLLTLEEPPKHLIFILCTTEVDKVPQTIYNRCEVFEFSSLPTEQMTKRLEYICTKEKFEYELDALMLISNMADGSMRQAITYLEQCSSMPVTVQTVKSVLLADTYDNYLNLIYAVLDRDYKEIVKLVKAVSNIDKYVMGLFSFLLDANIYNKTQDKSLIDVPDIYVEDFNKFTIKDKQQIDNLCDVLLELQFEGRNNPILKQLVIGTLYKFIGGNR